MEKPWFQHYDYFVPATIRYPKIPIYYMLDLAASKYKDSPATDFYGAEISFQRLRSAKYFAKNSGPRKSRKPKKQKRRGSPRERPILLSFRVNCFHDMVR